MDEFSTEIRCGPPRDGEQRRLLKAGPLTAIFANGSLIDIKAGRHEAVRQIYGAVRDRNWGTAECTLTSCRIDDFGDSFSVRFQAEHVGSEVDFTWEGTIIGTAGGTITYSFNGASRKDFMRNRIGLCVLHPMELAGVPVELETLEGRLNGAFPVRMSPFQPFLDIAAIRHDVGPNWRIEIKFDGEVFEMEDQRMWTDTSYKTYGTPLRLPFPVKIEAGETVSQSVTLTLVQANGASAAGSMEENEAVSGNAVCSVEVSEETAGTMPPLGLNRMPDTPPMDGTGRRQELLKALRLQHIRAEIDLTAADWAEVFADAVADVKEAGCSLELEVQTDPFGQTFGKLIDWIVERNVPVVRFFMYPAGGLVTTQQVLTRAAKKLKEAGLQAELGGGSRAYFTQLNRAADEIPWNFMACVQYSINPQVHAFDNDTLIQSLPVQALTVDNAHAIAGALPVHVGPVTLKPRFQATATGPTVKSREDELPFNVDARQATLLCAGWTVGSMRNLAMAGAASLTYFETLGRRGVMPHAADSSPPGHAAAFPVYHIFADVGEFAGADLLRVHIRTPHRLEALALRKQRMLRLLLCSFSEEDCRIELALPSFVAAQIRLLDETTARKAMTEPERFRSAVHLRVQGPSQRLTLGLRPFAVACVDAELMEVENTR